MKRLTSILAISVIAVMSAGAARADIASTTYVDDKVSPVATKADTNASDITALKSGKQDKSAMVDSTSENLTEDNDTNYPTVAAVYDIANNALGSSVNAKLDKKFTGDANKSKAVITDAEGTITTGTISSAMITDGTIVNADIADNAAIAQSKISGLTASIADAKEAGTAATTALNSYKTSNDTALAAVKKTADDTASAVNNTTSGLAATKKIADDNAKKLANMATSETVNTLTTRVSTAETNITNLTNNKQNKLVSSGENANISGSNGVTVTVGTDGKIAVAGNQTAIDTALAGKQATLTTAQLNAVNSGITSAKVSSYDTAVTTANNALPKATYESQVGTVSAANMGTTATTVVGAIKEIKSAVSATDGAAVKTDQGAANKDKAVITDANGKVTTGTISSAMITDGTIVNADISSSAAIAQSKISGLTDALAGKIPVPTATNNTGLLVLTYNSTTKTYAWENIGR
ncbi:MAG TPA: hypothetical protein DEA31_01250 [Alphaproteobacteria bacterium]|nr:hypothetical protein [Alphaproteobacteria bacterium]